MNALQAVGTVFLVLTAGTLLIYVVGGQLTGARVVDRRWTQARSELGEDARELIAFDTRLLRPWGPSPAVEIAIMKARAAGEGWLEPALAPLHEGSPTCIRLIAGGLEGTRVAFVVAHTRSAGFISKHVALAASGIVEQPIPPVEAPLLDYVAQLERLARRAQEGAKKT